MTVLPFRFQIPLIKPDVRISPHLGFRTEVHSCFRPREVARCPFQSYRPERLVEVLVGIGSGASSLSLVFGAQPLSQPKSPCEIPSILGDAKPLDSTEAAPLESAFGELVEGLCPPGGLNVAVAEMSIDHAWSAALDADAGGLHAEPSPERDALLVALLRFPIDDPATEGLALTGFLRAAQLLLRDHERDHHRPSTFTALPSWGPW